MVKMTKLQKNIAEMTDDNPSVSNEELSEKLGVSITRVKKDYKWLEDQGKLNCLNPLSQQTLLLACQKTQISPVETRVIAEGPGVGLETSLNADLPRETLTVVSRAAGVEIYDKEIIERLQIPHIDKSATLAARKLGATNIVISVHGNNEDILKDWKTYKYLDNPQACTIVHGCHLGILEFIESVEFSKKLQGWKVFEAAIDELHKKGLGVSTKDLHGMRGLSLTNKGFDVGAKIKKDEIEAPFRALEKNHTPEKILCKKCKQELLQTTPYFKSDEITTGVMLKAYGLAEIENWSLPFADFESQELICCPGCSAVLVDENGFLPKEVLYEIS